MNRILVSFLIVMMLFPTSASSQTPSADLHQTSGNAQQSLPSGEPNTVSVVAFMVESDGNIGLIVKNNTASVVSDVEVKVTVRDKSGSLVAVGDLSDVRVANLLPGSTAVGRVGGLKIADPGPDLVFEFDVNFDNGPADPRFSSRDIEFVDSSFSTDRILGEIKNPNREPLDKVYLGYACFSEDGEMTDRGWGSAHGQLDPGETTAFQIDVRTNCERYLISGVAFPD